ncbi:MAG: ABC transporter ATP-binding protein [Acidimicrobiia bacterium]|nr:MAG: ABC transporter ATP-binding protein [Acidimicrobiia bacterium]
MTPDPAFVVEPTIEVKSASKWFGQKVAVSHLSCSFGPGVTGLLGPNGAGKTTLLRMISGLTTVSHGSVAVLGKDPRKHHEVFRSVALVPDEDAVYDELTGRQLVRYSAQLSGVDATASVEATLDVVEMTDAADRLIDGYSKGMRQRIKVAAALVTDPQILILDEPLNGTDPIQRGRLIALFERLGAEGKTIIVSSHVLEEVERVSTRVVAIVDGRLAAAGSVEAIRAAMHDIPYIVRINTDRPRALASALFTSPASIGVSVGDGILDVTTSDITTLGHDAPRLAKSIDASITGFRPQDQSLESVFRYLIDGK